jgi:hypothetical protein
MTMRFVFSLVLNDTDMLVDKRQPLCHIFNQFINNLMKGTTMKTKIALLAMILIFVTALPVNAGGKGDLQKYFSNTAAKVKATENPAEKRQILNESFQNMSNALDKVQNFWLISDNDRADLAHLKAIVQDKQDELSGINGYEKVSDSQLNNFSNYVVQSMEQADTTITISLVAALLIVILIVLLV